MKNCKKMEQNIEVDPFLQELHVQSKVERREKIIDIIRPANMILDTKI